MNGTQSANRAGYSERTASAQASSLLTNVSILARVEKLKKKRAIGSVKVVGSNPIYSISIRMAKDDRDDVLFAQNLFSLK